MWKHDVRSEQRNFFWNILSRLRRKNFLTKFFWLCHFFTILAILAENDSPRKRIYTGKKCRSRDFRFGIRFETFWIDSDKKIFFEQIFLAWSFLHYFGRFGWKTTVPGKNLHEKILSISRFSVKNAFWNILNWFQQKKSRPKFFDRHFLTILTILAEKRQSPRKKFNKGKKINFEIFGLKYVLKHSESTPTKKIFDQNFLTVIFSLFWPFWPKKTVPRTKFYTGKNFRFRDFQFKIRFKTFCIDYDQKKFEQNFLTLTFFYHF